MGQHKKNPVAIAVAEGKAVCQICRKIMTEVATTLKGVVYTCEACNEERRIQIAQNPHRPRDPRIDKILSMAAAMRAPRRTH